VGWGAGGEASRMRTGEREKDFGSVPERWSGEGLRRLRVAAVGLRGSGCGGLAGASGMLA
jgi:hypothetical protein